MALSKAAEKLLAWLGMYKLTATEYEQRISGEYPYDDLYNANWFIGVFDKGGEYGRITAAPQRGLFKDALAELVTSENPTTTTSTTLATTTTTTTVATTTTTTTSATTTTTTTV